MLKLKLQHFGHLMQRVDSLEKTLMLGGTGGRRRGDDRGWDGWMASLTRWSWVWVDSGILWWTGRPGVLQFTGSQSVRHDWATELTDWKVCCEPHFFSHLCTDHTTYVNDKSHFLFEGITQDLRLYEYVLPGAQRHSQLEAKLSTVVQGNPSLMALSSHLWVFLAFTVSGRDTPTHGCVCSGSKDWTQARGASQGLG